MVGVWGDRGVRAREDVGTLIVDLWVWVYDIKEIVQDFNFSAIVKPCGFLHLTLPGRKLV